MYVSTITCTYMRAREYVLDSFRDTVGTSPYAITNLSTTIARHHIFYQVPIGTTFSA